MENLLKILLVEDNEGDIVLTTQAFKKAKVYNGISIARDGEEAVRYLKKEGVFVNAETPNLILLDINLPRLNGLEVLAEIKNDKKLLSIPVVIMTTSKSEKDIMESYTKHANCYVIKPGDFTKFSEVIQMIRDFWISIVRLPNQYSLEG